MNVTRDVLTRLSEILDYNKQSILLSGAIMYMYTKSQIWWHIHCCHR